MATTGSEQYVGNLLSLMSTLMENKRAKQEAKESRMFDLGMAQWYQQAQSAQQMDQMRLQSALEQDARLEDRRAELLAKVGHVSEVNKALETITDRTPATTGLLSKELEAINREHETIASQREEYAGVIAGLQARSTARQKEIDTLLGYMSEQETGRYERESGWKEAEIAQGWKGLSIEEQRLGLQRQQVEADIAAGGGDIVAQTMKVIQAGLDASKPTYRTEDIIVWKKPPDPETGEKGEPQLTSSGQPVTYPKETLISGDPAMHSTYQNLMDQFARGQLGVEEILPPAPPTWETLPDILQERVSAGDQEAIQHLETIKKYGSLEELKSKGEEAIGLQEELGGGMAYTINRLIYGLSPKSKEEPFQYRKPTEDETALLGEGIATQAALEYFQRVLGVTF